MAGKRNASLEALKFVKDGMTVGLGSGSTAAVFIELLAEKVKAENLKIKCIPTSLSSKAIAYKCGLPLLEPSEVHRIDLAVDGADLVDSKLNLIKGGGAAHVREKVIDYFADKFVVIVDEGKLSKTLKGPVPLEILHFSLPFVEKELKRQFGVKLELRRKGNGDVLLSDNGNYIADAIFKPIKNPAKLEQQLDVIPGIIGNGIFSRRVHAVIVGYEKKVKVLGKRK